MKRLFFPLCTLLLGTAASFAETNAETIDGTEKQYTNTYVEGDTNLPSTYVEGSKKLSSTFIYDPSIQKENNSWWNKIRANGSIQSEFLIPFDLKGDKTGEYEKDVLNNTYFDLTVNAPYVSFGARLEWAKWPLPGYEKGFGGWGVPYIWATGGYKCWQATVGDFYEQFGSGLILRIYQERSLGVDNAIRGGRLKLNVAPGVHLTALGGKQRCYWEWNSSWLWGADAEWSLNETFKERFKRNTGVTLGFSYVGKHDKQEQHMVTPSPSLVPNQEPGYDYYLHFPENVAAFDGRIKVRANDFNFLFEYATKNNDPNSFNNYTYRRGEAFLLSGTYSKNGFSALLQAKRSDNMDFRSKREIDPRKEMLTSTINHLPAFTLTQTFALAAMYPYATQADGEWAFQTDLRYLFKKKTPLGGKYGTNVRLSASYISGLDYNKPAGTTSVDPEPGTNQFGSPFWKIGSLYYADLNFELNKKLSRKYQMTFFYMFQKYNQTIVEGEGGMVTSNIFIYEGQWKMAKKAQLRFEAQYLNTKQDKGDWIAGLAEVSFAPHWMVTVTDTWNTTHNDNYYSFLVTYNLKSNRFTFGYGRVRAGYNCSGGVCRWVPETKGFNLTYNYTF